jgi:uncharacterized protein involved in exopolysaccharide biosynthesis/Mrp family chromosome partitioning ATPase
LFGIVLRQAWLILAVTALFVAAALAFLMVVERTYSASIEILLDPRDLNVLPNQVSPAGTGSDAALVESQLSVLTSDATLGRVVDTLKLTDDQEWVKERELTAYLEARANNGARDVAARAIAIDNLRKAVTVRRAERTYVIEIRVQSREASKAMRIADAIAAAYVADQADAARTRTRNANEALTARLTSLRAELRAAEEKLQAFRERNGLVGAQGTLVSDQQLQELSLRLIQAQVRAAEARSRSERLASLARGQGLQGTSEALASPVLTALKGQLAEARRREAELAPALGDNHPFLIDARAQVAALQGQIGQETARIARAANADADVAAAQEKELTAALADLKTRAQSVDAALIGQRDLDRDVQSARQIYETFLNRAKETRERDAIETSNARVIAPASLLSRTPSPSRTLILALALAAGLGLGSAIALFRAHARNAVSGPAHMRALTGVETIGVGAPKRGAASLNPFAGEAAYLDRHVRHPALGVAARALRNELRDTPQRRSERSVLCVEPSGRLAASALALKVAEAVAIGGERVLLIDAAREAGPLTQRLGAAGKPGLRQVLGGTLVKDAMVEVKELGIWFLGQGTDPAGRTAAESAKLGQTLLAAAAQFDFVVVAGGPVLTDADALSLASAAEQIVLASDADTIDADAVQRALRLMGSARGKLRRAVLLSASAS